jgi:type II secretory pathway component PulM
LTAGESNSNPPVALVMGLLWLMIAAYWRGCKRRSRFAQVAMATVPLLIRKYMFLWQYRKKKRGLIDVLTMWTWSLEKTVG